MPIRDVLLAVSVPCVWGFGFVIAKPGMEQFPPLLINGLRWTLTGLILVWWYPIPKKLIKDLLILSFIGCSIQYSLTFSGLNIIEASSAVLLVQCEVPFGVLIACLLLKEKPSTKNIIGLCIAFFGVIILAGAPNLENKYLGVLLILGGAMTWALAQVLAKPLSKKINGIRLTAWIGILAGPQLIFASALFEGNTIEYIKMANAYAWIIVLYLALVMNAFGYSIWYHILSIYPVNVVMPVLLLLPVTGVVAAIVLLGERPDLVVFIGGIVIIIGVGLILFNKKNKQSNPRQIE